MESRLVGARRLGMPAAVLLCCLLGCQGGSVVVPDQNGSPSGSSGGGSSSGGASSSGGSSSGGSSGGSSSGGSSGGSSSGGAVRPSVTSFAAAPTQIAPGGQSTLTWSISSATSVTIDNGVGDVTGRSSVAVTPGATTTYTISATGPGGTAQAQVTVTVSAQPAPTIGAFTASPAVISPGGSSQLGWSVTGATALRIDQGVGDVTARTAVTVTPGATTTYTLTATGAGGTRTAAATVTVTSSGSADATLVVDTTQGRTAISPYVYGYNPAGAGSATWTPSAASAPAGTTIWREGGNRTTAYSWASNYSNAGSDWGPYASDTHMGSPTDGPGHAIVPMIDHARSSGLAALVTVPIQGWVAKDASGNVSLGTALTDHFIPNKARKGSAFTTSPSPASAEVYQDELAAFVAQRWGSGHEIHLSLDNEPDLWSATHKEIERTQTTYASYLSRYLDASSAIRDAVPAAILYGPASYGWWGYVNFAGAPDAPAGTGADAMFIDWFLGKVSEASSQKGRRLLDVLDLHFYSEAQSSGCASSGDDGVRVVTWSGDGNYAKRNLDCVVAARVQSARSLGDAAFVESSSITRDSTRWSAQGQPIRLLPRMTAKIAAAYPGTRLAITEYNFGGGDHVSGAIAQAEALGLMGREGAYAGMLWEMLTDSSFIGAAFRHYRSYDGAGSHFGDTAVSASSSDQDHVGVYASVDAASDGRVVLVIVHRPTLSGGSLDLKARTVKVQWTHPRTLGKARAWQTTSASATPQAIQAPAPSGNTVTLTLPGMSVTTLELTP